MNTFDIPINIKVKAETEEQAEDFVTGFMEKLLNGAALTRPFITWDFIEFITEEECPIDSSTLSL
jgi:hypothetical protein